MSEPAADDRDGKSRAAVLRALPLALNEKWSRIEIGEGGFELFDTPRSVGQHTLARPRPIVVREKDL